MGIFDIPVGREHYVLGEEHNSFSSHPLIVELINMVTFTIDIVHEKG